MTLDNTTRPGFWRATVLIGVLCAGIALAQTVHAQGVEISRDKPVPTEPLLAGLVQQFGQQYADVSFCIGGMSVHSVRMVVQDEAKRQGLTELPTPRQTYSFMASRLPCPISPYREGVRAATADDVRGAWVTPEGSEALAMPPRLRATSKLPPLRCEALGLFQDGEARNIEMRGRFQASTACMVSTAASFDVARANPRTTTWMMTSPGLLTFTRSDVPGHEELWETFIVDTPFTVQSFQFQKGDMISYLRKSPYSTPGVAERFRHLRKLPQAKTSPAI